MRQLHNPIMFKFCTLLVLLFLPLCQASAADDFESFKRQQMQGTQQIKNEFHNYKEQQDREFAGFLKQQWVKFDTHQGEVRLKEPEPKVAPVAPPPPGSKPVAVTPPLVPAAAPPAPPPAQPVTLAADEMQVDFFGNTVKFAFDPQWKSYRLTGGAKPETISDFWGQMSGSKYEATLAAINAARQRLKLDDWGYATLWREVVQALQPQRKTEQNLLLWFFLIKSGYDVRVGYYNSDVFLFEAIQQKVYASKYTIVNRRTYYAALAEDRGLGILAYFSYKADYPSKLKPLDIQSASTDFTGGVRAQRTLAFDYNGQSIQLHVPYDRRLIEYLETFPQIDFEVYFDTQASPVLREGLLPQLRKYTDKMNETEAVNFLLAFVQHAFAYKTDIEQFGYQKCFFIEESLHFPYNDCKDRSVIFAWLVRELVGIKVIGLLFPGHMNTAVELKQVKEGYTTVSYQGRRYVIADPTYLGATVGMAMPIYARQEPKRIMEIQ